MKRLSQTASAITLGIALQTANAGENFVRPEPIIIGSPEFQKICEDAKNKTGLLLDGQEICEISVDQGKTWVSLAEFLAAGGVLVGAGALAYMIRRRIKVGDMTNEEKLANAIALEKEQYQITFEKRKNKKVKEILEEQNELKNFILGKIESLEKIGDKFELDGNIIERTDTGFNFIEEEDTTGFHSVDELFAKILTMYGKPVEQLIILSKLGTVDTIARFSALTGKEIGDTGIRIMKNEENNFVFERKVSSDVWSLVDLKKMLEEEPSDILMIGEFSKIQKAKIYRILQEVLRVRKIEKIRRKIRTMKNISKKSKKTNT